MSSKKLPSLLPPKRSPKRDAGVNVRFTQDEYDALERIANFRETTVTELVYYVVARAAFPQLREEMEAEIAASQTILSDSMEQKQTGENIQQAQIRSLRSAAPSTHLE